MVFAARYAVEISCVVLGLMAGQLYPLTHLEVDAPKIHVPALEFQA
jgi:hypothetical protein